LNYKNAPVKIPFYEEKFEYLRGKQNVSIFKGVCAISMTLIKNGIRPMTELHHAGIHNTKTNRKLYPILIHSPFNLVGVDKWYHEQYRNFGKKSKVWADRIEKFLQSKHHNKWRNFALRGEYVS